MSAPVRAVFDEEATARSVAAKLTAQGFEVAVRREPFAGEDDDEDHPWALVTDAPAILLELIAEEYDGWVDFDEEPQRERAPLDLPSAPRRSHRDT